MIRQSNNNSMMLAKRAMAIAKKLNSVEMGVEKSLLISALKRRLQMGVVRFAYQKKDGTIREAFGTLDRVIIKAKVKGTGTSPEEYQCCCYFDIEKGAFRSFRWENLIAIFRN